jgi:hypothetical protein
MLVVSAFLRVRQGPIAVWIFATVVASSGLGFLMARFLSEPANLALRGKRIKQAPQAVEHVGR